MDRSAISAVKWTAIAVVLGFGVSTTLAQNAAPGTTSTRRQARSQRYTIAKTALI